MGTEAEALLKELFIKCIKNNISIYYTASGFGIELYDPNIKAKIGGGLIVGNHQYSSLESIRNISNSLDRYMEVGAC